MGAILQDVGFGTAQRRLPERGIYGVATVGANAVSAWVGCNSRMAQHGVMSMK
jgi:hypothetical protein